MSIFLPKPLLLHVRQNVTARHSEGTGKSACVHPMKSQAFATRGYLQWQSIEV